MEEREEEGDEEGDEEETLQFIGENERKPVCLEI